MADIDLGRVRLMVHQTVQKCRPAWIQSSAARAQHTMPRSCSQRCQTVWSMMGHGSHGSKVCSWKSGLQRIALFELDCTPPLKPGEYRRPSELTAQWISVLYVITRVVRVVRVIEFALKFFDHSCDHCDPQWLHLPNCCRLPGFCSPTASTLPCPTVSPPIAWPICSGQCLDQKQQLCRYKNSSRLFDLKNHRSSSNTRFFGMFFIGTVGL